MTGPCAGTPIQYPPSDARRERTNPMQRQEKVAEIATLLQETGHAHHRAFAATDGADPDWAIWYADHMSTSLPASLGATLTKSDIVRLLVDLDREATARATEGTPWPQFYGQQLVDRFVAADEETLTLYMTPGCPFCRLVTATIERLGLDIPMLDVWQDRQARADLIAARGRATVPVLRCKAGDLDRWMPESADIVRYLEKRFGT